MQWWTVKHTIGVILIGLGVAACMPQGGGRMGEPVDIYAIGPDRFPIIFWEVETNNFRAVQALLDAGADIEARGFARNTPVIWAANGSNWEMVKFLIDRGADLTAYSFDGRTVANRAVSSRLVLTSIEGQHLQDVRAILRQRGWYDNVPTSATLRAQMAAGTLPEPPRFDRDNWPPR